MAPIVKYSPNIYNFPHIASWKTLENTIKYIIIIIMFTKTHWISNVRSLFSDAFMEEISRDADRRYKDKQIRKEKAETFKKQASLAFGRGEYEKALNYYNKVT